MERHFTNFSLLEIALPQLPQLPRMLQLLECLFIQCNEAATLIISSAVVLSRRRYRRSPGYFSTEIPVLA
jgi:hypothetical protein